MNGIFEVFESIVENAKDVSTEKLAILAIAIIAIGAVVTKPAAEESN